MEPESTDEPDRPTTRPSTTTAGEMEPVAVATEPVQHELDGVTESADWGWDDPEDYSAPV